MIVSRRHLGLSLFAWSAEAQKLCSDCELISRCAADYQSEIAYRQTVAVRISDSGSSEGETRYNIELIGIPPSLYFARKRVSQPMLADVSVVRNNSDLIAVDWRERQFVKAAWSQGLPDARYLADLHFQHHGRFALLDRINASAQVLDRRKQYVRFRMVSLDEAEPWTEELMIDIETNRVTKSTLIREEFRGDTGKVRVRTAMKFTIASAPKELDFQLSGPWEKFRRTNTIITP